MARIGLGGSFQPGPSGPSRISLAAAARAFDEVWWLVSPAISKKAKDMVISMPARIGKLVARGTRIRVSDFEEREGSRFTVDTVRRLKRRYPEHRFIWLLGSDTLPNFHNWRDWRGLARELPIAVVRRPGYDSAAHAARAMGWLGRFVQPSSQARNWTDWSAPAILFLRQPPDPTSATALRAQDPNWYRRSPPLAQRPRSPCVPLSSRRPLDRTSS
jgi:nicotinate-nucleotide adenylyltransferase